MAHLTQEQRYTIEVLLKANKSKKEIAFIIHIEGRMYRDATTFFPKNWNKQRIKEEVAIAFFKKK